MTFKKSLISAAFLAGVALPALAMPANSQEAEVTADLNMRMGPGTRYPVIDTIPDGRIVRVYGCVRGYDWCDVRWRRTRGWVFADYLRYRYDGRWRMLPDWGPASICQSSVSQLVIMHIATTEVRAITTA